MIWWGVRWCRLGGGRCIDSDVVGCEVGADLREEGVGTLMWWGVRWMQTWGRKVCGHLCGGV